MFILNVIYSLRTPVNIKRLLSMSSEITAYSCSIFTIIIVIIIIIKNGKADRDRLTPYQAGDPRHTIPTLRMKEEKGKTVGDKKPTSS